MGPVRKRRTLVLPRSPTPPPPRGRVLALPAPPGGPGLDAMAVWPETRPRGVLFSLVGYATALDAWEAARLGLLARTSGLVAIAAELPGMSTHRTPLDRAMRRSIARGDVADMAAVTADVLLDAARRAAAPLDGVRQILGYSTGCSLAASAAPRLAGPSGRFESCLLIEPVALTSRSLVGLAWANARDALRKPATHRQNAVHPWVAEAIRRPGEPRVSVSLPDTVALAGTLRRPGLLTAAASGAIAAQRVHLVRGERSDLCTASGLRALDAALADAGVPGETVTVAGAGHPVWLSARAVWALAPLVAPSSTLPPLSEQAAHQLGGEVVEAVDHRVGEGQDVLFGRVEVRGDGDDAQTRRQG